MLWVPFNMGMSAAHCQGISECLESGHPVLHYDKHCAPHCTPLWIQSTQNLKFSFRLACIAVFLFHCSLLVAQSLNQIRHGFTWFMLTAYRWFYNNNNNNNFACVMTNHMWSQMEQISQWCVWKFHKVYPPGWFRISPQDWLGIYVVLVAVKCVTPASCWLDVDAIVSGCTDAISLVVIMHSSWVAEFTIFSELEGMSVAGFWSWLSLDHVD